MTDEFGGIMAHICTSEKSEVKRGEENHSHDHELRLVLIGRTGSGKSATGNTILGRRHFLSEMRASSVTQVCEQGSVELPENEADKHMNVLVVDVPGFGDTQADPSDVHMEMAKCVALSAPGPHAFLLVIQLGRYTEDEDRAVRQMLRLFGESALQRHTVVVFTHGDDLEECGGNLEIFLGQDVPEALKSLLEICGRRYHVLNNKNKDRQQVKELLRKVEKMVEENGEQYYTSAMFQEAELAIREEQKRLMLNQGAADTQGALVLSKRRRTDCEERAEEMWVEERSAEQCWLLKEGWQKWKDRRGRSGLQSLRTEAALSPKVLQRVKVLVAAGATGFAVGAVCGAVAPLALAAGASVVSSSVGITVGIAGNTAVAIGAAVGGVVGGANGVLIGAEAAAPGEAALDTLEQVGLLGVTVVGGAAVLGGALGVGAGLVGAGLEGGAAIAGAETISIANAGAAAAPQALGGAVVEGIATGRGLTAAAGTSRRILTAVTELGRVAAGVVLGGGLVVKVVKEKTHSGNASTDRKSYELSWNK